MSLRAQVWAGGPAAVSVYIIMSTGRTLSIGSLFRDIATLKRLLNYPDTPRTPANVRVANFGTDRNVHAIGNAEWYMSCMTRRGGGPGPGRGPGWGLDNITPVIYRSISKCKWTCHIGRAASDTPSPSPSLSSLGSRFGER